jgi:hypothetical protein
MNNGNHGQGSGNSGPGGGHSGPGGGNSGPGGGNPGQGGGQAGLVHVTIDGDSKRIPAGNYRVDQLKTALGVPPEKELDQIVDGTIKPLEDNAFIKISGEERFISHVRSGGSS